MEFWFGEGKGYSGVMEWEGGDKWKVDFGLNGWLR